MRSTLRLSVDVSSCSISQTWADRASPELGRHNEDVQLAGLEACRAQGAVVDLCDDPIQ